MTCSNTFGGHECGCQDGFAPTLSASSPEPRWPRATALPHARIVRTHAPALRASAPPISVPCPTIGSRPRRRWRWLWGTPPPASASLPGSQRLGGTWADQVGRWTLAGRTTGGRAVRGARCAVQSVVGWGCSAWCLPPALVSGGYKHTPCKTLASRTCCNTSHPFRSCNQTSGLVVLDARKQGWLPHECSLYAYVRSCGAQWSVCLGALLSLLGPLVTGEQPWE